MKVAVLLDYDVDAPQLKESLGAEPIDAALSDLKELLHVEGRHTLGSFKVLKVEEVK
jgi:hypothetical protein